MPKNEIDIAKETRIFTFLALLDMKKKKEKATNLTLSRRLGKSAAHTCQIVSEMKKMGYLKVEKNGNNENGHGIDKRETVISLTKFGEFMAKTVRLQVSMISDRDELLEAGLKVVSGLQNLIDRSKDDERDEDA